jgi:hypothetical protein
MPMDTHEIDRATDVLKVGAVLGTLAVSIGVFVGLILADFAWWIALLAAGGMVCAEIVVWTRVFKQQEMAREKILLAKMSGEDQQPEQSTP